jgi:choline dehydrogenase-like flavoprotein
LIIDLEKTSLDGLSGFDVCVVGAGAAGLVVAVELVQQGKRVLVLEGGGLKKWERKSQALNKSRVVGLPFPGAHVGRFRTLGGSTSRWAGQVIEMDGMDFETRHWVPGSGWPIKKTDLAVGYRRALELEGLSASLPDGEVWTHTGVSAPNLSDDLGFAFSRICPEQKFSRLFQDILNTDPNLVVALHANACQLIFAEDGETITSVRCRTLTGVDTYISADRFVLCLGAIESSRFLLNQPIAPWNRSGLVGRHFKDHIACFAADVINFRMADNWYYGPYRIKLNQHYYVPKLKLSASAQERYSVLNASGWLEYDAGIFRALRTAALIRAGHLSAARPRELAYTALKAPAVVWWLSRMRTDPNFVLPWAKLKLSVYCEQSPLSESLIALSSECDALGLRRASIDWTVSTQEVETIRRYVQVARDVFHKLRIADIVPDNDLFTDRILQKFSDYFHHMGGTRMANSAIAGVVDPDLRLYGTRNIYVCSASVFPSSGSANPTHTLLALAVRLASHLQHLPSQRSAVRFHNTSA